jgi:hypothetical protein
MTGSDMDYMVMLAVQQLNGRGEIASYTNISEYITRAFHEVPNRRTFQGSLKRLIKEEVLEKIALTKKGEAHEHRVSYYFKGHSEQDSKKGLHTG